MQQLKISRNKSLRAQIADQLRESILRGDIIPGTKLPSTTALSEQWGTQTANVHAALSTLVREGLLTRKNGVGTIVNKRKKVLDTILIYQSERNDEIDNMSSFYRQLQSAVKEELSSRGLRCHIVYTHQFQNHFSYVQELIDKEIVQGIILLSSNAEKRQKLDRLPVPYSCITTARVKNRVSLSFDSLAEKARDGLVAQGCAKAGMILALAPNNPDVDTGTLERRHFIKKLISLLRESGIETRDEWIYTADKVEGCKITDYDQFAFDGFNQIWKGAKEPLAAVAQDIPQRRDGCAATVSAGYQRLGNGKNIEKSTVRGDDKPDGLFVYTDELISGTLIGILANKVAVPEQLKLVLHRNRGCNVLCPMPGYFVENNVQEMAEGLVQLVVDQYEGREVNQIKFEYKLVENK